MTVEELSEDEVVAMRFDQPSDAADLARWCDGVLELVQDDPEDAIVWVPTPKGPRGLRVGMWLKRLPDGTHDVDTAEDFAAKHQPG